MKIWKYGENKILYIKGKNNEKERKRGKKEEAS